MQTHPDVLENHLRLAEAYIALGDPAPAGPHLCRCLANKAALRPDDQRLLQQLIDDAGLATVRADNGRSALRAAPRVRSAGPLPLVAANGYQGCPLCTGPI